MRSRRHVVQAADALEEQPAEQRDDHVKRRRNGRTVHCSSMESTTGHVKALPAKTPTMGRARLRKNSGSGKLARRPATAIAATVSEPSIHGRGSGSIEKARRRATTEES